MGSLAENVHNKDDWTNVGVRENLGRKVNVHRFDVDKQTIALIGDEHIGSKYHAEDELKENLEWCYEHGVPIILMGDEMETATKTSVGAGIYEQEDIVQEQLERTVADRKSTRLNSSHYS